MNCATIHKKFFQQVTRPNCQTPDEPHQPLQHVDHIKRNEKQFPHLRRMDPLMVDDIAVDP